MRRRDRWGPTEGCFDFPCFLPSPYLDVQHRAPKPPCQPALLLGAARAHGGGKVQEGRQRCGGGRGGGARRGRGRRGGRGGVEGSAEVGGEARPDPQEEGLLQLGAVCRSDVEEELEGPCGAPMWGLCSHVWGVVSGHCTTTSSDLAQVQWLPLATSNSFRGSSRTRRGLGIVIISNPFITPPVAWPNAFERPKGPQHRRPLACAFYTWRQAWRMRNTDC